MNTERKYFETKEDKEIELNRLKKLRRALETSQYNLFKLWVDDFNGHGYFDLKTKLENILNDICLQIGRVSSELAEEVL